MSNVAEMSPNRLPQDLLQKHGAALDAWFDERFAKKLKEVEESKTLCLANSKSRRRRKPEVGEIQGYAAAGNWYKPWQWDAQRKPLNGSIPR